MISLKKSLFIILLFIQYIHANNNIYIINGNTVSSINKSINEIQSNYSYKVQVEHSDLLKKIINELVRISVLELTNQGYKQGTIEFDDNLKVLSKEKIVKVLNNNSFENLQELYDFYINNDRQEFLLYIKKSIYDKNKKIKGLNIEEYKKNLIKETNKMNILDKKIISDIMEKTFKKSVKYAKDNNSSIEEEFLKILNNKTIDEIFEMED